jgi:cytochrome d ubiquinol oxidase subunit I
VLEGLAFFTRKPVWARLSAFWTRIFAVWFGMGVVSGIVMPFQMGTNWSRFSDTTANVLARLLAYEGLTAFFLEASFLGVLLFGRKLVPPWLHFFAGLMVAAGTLFSTFWILSVNSWMQTPAGFHVENGRFFPNDWWKVIFNPAFPYRYVHNVTAFYITTGFVVLGVGAWLLQRGRSQPEARLMMRMALNLLIVLVPLQMIVGDLHGTNTGKYQPAKLAAIEGRYDEAKPEPLTLVGVPDDATGTMRYAVQVPVLGSILLTHSLTGGIRGLNSFPRDQRPPVGPPFFAFRIMVGLAVVMLFVAVTGQVLLRRRQALDRSA